MLDLRDELSKQIPDNLVTLKSENDVLKRSIAELTEKCQKLEKKAKDFERLIGEQNSLMKALNVKRKFYFLFASCLISTVLLLFYTNREPY